jgi:ferritin-like metal-binding protein YciE
LKAVLHKYIDFVKGHIKKLDGFFEGEGINAINLDNRVMQAFIEETQEKLSRCADIAVLDARLLACIQAINHFKISAYGTAAAFARTLEMGKAAAIFRELEINEKNIDHNLSRLAENEINITAIAPIVLTQ